MICPIGEPDHENNEVYELYRAKCETDDCNIMDPRCDMETGLGADNNTHCRTENGGGGNNNNGGIVIL